MAMEQNPSEEPQADISYIWQFYLHDLNIHGKAGRQLRKSFKRHVANHGFTTAGIFEYDDETERYLSVLELGAGYVTEQSDIDTIRLQTATCVYDFLRNKGVDYPDIQMVELWQEPLGCERYRIDHTAECKSLIEGLGSLAQMKPSDFSDGPNLV